MLITISNKIIICIICPPWQGTFYLVAIYNRNLRPNEIQQNYKAGARTTSTMLAKSQLSPNARLFETEIAPLFARHCLECHDSASKKGGLPQIQ